MLLVNKYSFNSIHFIKFNLYLWFREFQIDNLSEPNPLMTPLTRTEDKNAASAAFQNLTRAAQLVGY